MRKNPGNTAEKQRFKSDSGNMTPKQRRIKPSLEPACHSQKILVGSSRPSPKTSYAIKPKFKSKLSANTNTNTTEVLAIPKTSLSARNTANRCNKWTWYTNRHPQQKNLRSQQQQSRLEISQIKSFPHRRHIITALFFIEYFVSSIEFIVKTFSFSPMKEGGSRRKYLTVNNDNNNNNKGEALNKNGMKNQFFHRFPITFVSSLFLILLSLATICPVNGQMEKCPDPSPQEVQVECADSFHHKYRTYDGSCNNFARTHWGSSNIPLLRLLPPQYEDESNIPFGEKTGKKNGFSIPNPREISQIIMSAHAPDHNEHDDEHHSAMLAHWGQFLAHDMSLAKEAEVDCKKDKHDRDNCFNIRIPKSDERIPLNGTFPFKRTVSCTDGGLREQVNSLTAYVDASTIYGSNQLAALRIRDRFPADFGKLRQNPQYRSQLGRGYLVFDESGEMSCFRNKTKRDGMECYLSGDVRANEQLMLTAMHTVFMREHNRIADELNRINPEWPGETIFQETRKIVTAIIQHISYEHWLPKILGTIGMNMIGKYKGYDPSVNAGIANAISAAAMRFGHTMVVPELKRMDTNYRPDRHLPAVKLRDAFFAPESLIQNGGIEPLLRGAISSPVKDISPDSLVSGELTNHLFPNAHAFPLDLAAMNIQRGRDHALQSYNEWRSLCGLERIWTWEQFENEARDKSVIHQVSVLYGKPENLDLWVGGLLEKPLKGGKIGRTFSCLLADQFKRIRQGDRFWFENPGVFGLSQLNSIRQYSLSKLFCNNLDYVTKVPKDAFLFYPHRAREYLRCDELMDINLNLWRIEENGIAGAFECSSPDCTCRYQIGSWGKCESEPGGGRSSSSASSPFSSVDSSGGRGRPLQKRYDLLVVGEYPPCTAQRPVARPCPGGGSQQSRPLSVSSSSSIRRRSSSSSGNRDPRPGRHHKDKKADHLIRREKQHVVRAGSSKGGGRNGRPVSVSSSSSIKTFSTVGGRRRPFSSSSNRNIRRHRIFNRRRRVLSQFKNPENGIKS